MVFLLAKSRRFLLVVLLSFCAEASSFNEEIPLEYQVKAAYLLNLIRFVQWPSYRSPDNTLVCVYGYNPFNHYLKRLESKQVKGRGIAVEYLREDKLLDTCDLVFVSKKNDKRFLQKVIASKNTTLTVGDSEDFLQLGGMLAFVLIDGRVLLQVDLTQAKAKGFTISANLLSIANRVY